ncbi:YsnF/AvaK domain-containing protein [Azospirillum agricola]|uniref:YsnF/AvaK domain-containing protein n=1 Tax=Azospirillum agricola TaxID=1720247 RepID=UPI000A0F0906|nr:YsnF/AvaK domain-containing protein [Azospirillum agricola]SMH37914.1 conserved domain-containing protein [Azospirillum lipoferum]
MNKTIVALYDTRTDAEAALRDLEAEGFDRGVGELVSHNDAGMSGSYLSRLSDWNVPEADAHVYAEGMRRGGTLLTLRVDDDDVERAIAVLERGAVIDIGQRGEAYRSTGWMGYDETAAPYDEASAVEERARYAVGGTRGDARLGSAAEAFRGVNRTDVTADTAMPSGVGSEREEVLPVTEEELTIGKRAVERGSIRVRSYVVETPVEEQVRLRDETVTVERRPVTREVGDIPADAFRERTIEVSETDEEAVIQKRTLVKEEVVVRKDVEERAQTVSDTVRRTEVEIEDDRTQRSGMGNTVRRDDVER